MAHHIFRRCLLVDIVPPAPPMAEGDYRLVIGDGFSLCIDVANGTELGASITSLDVMRNLTIAPLSPGVDTGLGYYRLDVVALEGPAILFLGVEIQGSFAAGGLTI